VAEVLLQPWSEDDLPLLQKLLGDPEMTEHLGGPETPEQILRRHQRYLHLPEDSTDHMFKIARGPDSQGVGSIGYWKKNWRDRLVYETGWLVLPEYQGQGIASKAAQAVVEHARQEPSFRFMHAFPSVNNVPSNAICLRLGFTLVETCQVEYPPGRTMLVNDWRLDLLQTAT
jgi:RimJ/RimL family protein N-acetyltransferase